MTLLLAVLLDLLVGEPPGWLHPVNWIGAGISALERRAPADERQDVFAYGLRSLLAVSGATAATAFVASRLTRRLPAVPRLLLGAALLKPAFSLRMLLDAGQRVRESLERGDLDGARSELLNLVGRDTSTLSAEECASAAVESLAENTADSLLGPWLGYALFGLPGAWLVRAVNTLDSRWGYHGRYELLGRSAARLDDWVAWVPARLSALLLIAAAPASAGSPRDAWRAMRRDHALTESPNAGWTMSAMAGALDRRLSKPGHYTLNNSAAPCGADDILRAEGIVLAAALLGALLIAASHLGRID